MQKEVLADLAWHGTAWRQVCSVGCATSMLYYAVGKAEQ